MSLTQSDLAEKLSVSPQAVSKWENDNAYPDITILSDLASILQCSVDTLLNGFVPADTRFDSDVTKKKNLDDLVFRIRIIDGGTKVNVNLPLPLLEAFRGMDASSLTIASGDGTTDMLKAIDIDKLIELAERGVLGKLVEIEGEDGESVLIFVE